MIVAVMGVSGSGKTTIATALAAALGCTFLEADSFHPQANIAKMSEGIPLSDADRAPWLKDLHERLLAAHKQGESLVLACSALKQSYRDELAQGLTIRWIYLKGSPELIASRLR